MMIRWLFPILAVGTISCVAIADDRKDESRQIRDWVASGRILSLDQLLAMHRDRLRGRLLDVEVERKRGRIIYELETIDDNGVIREIKLDAASGEWLEEEIED